MIVIVQASQTIAVSRPRPERREGGQPPVEHLILNYAAFQIDDSDKPVGAHHLLRQIKELAPETRESPVAFFIQGYEKSPEGRWQVARYAVAGGQITDLTAEIQGTKLIYNHAPWYEKRAVVGREPGSGGGVSMLQGDTLKDFLVDGLTSFPGARYVSYVNNTHGRGMDGLAGEALIKGKLVSSTRETMPFGDCRQALSEARNQLGRPLDLVVFDSCLMGQFEVVNSLSDVTKTVVASPEVEWVPDSAPYPTPQALLPAYGKLLDDPHMTAQQFAHQILDKTVAQSKFRDFKGDLQDCTPTLAIYDTARCVEARDALGHLGEALCLALDVPEKRAAIVDSVKDSFAYPHQSSNLLGGDPLDTPLKDLKSFLQPLKKVVEAALVDQVERKLDLVPDEFFRGKMGWVRYKEVGPFSGFLPDVERNMCFQGRFASDINASLGHLIKRGLSPDWVTHNLQELVAYSTDYRQLLSLTPDPRVEKALNDNAALFSQLSGIHKTIEAAGFGDARQAAIAAHADQIQQVIQKLHEGMREIDFGDFVDRCNKLKRDGVKARFQTSFEERYREKLEVYSALPGVPAGWNRFVHKLSDVMAGEVLPSILSKM